MNPFFRRVTRRMRTMAKQIATRGERRKYAWLPRWAELHCEADVHPHVPAERAELFDAFNTGTTEFELLNWVHATVMLIKPEAVLETGAANGLGTIALASACSN